MKVKIRNGIGMKMEQGFNGCSKSVSYFELTVSVWSLNFITEVFAE